MLPAKREFVENEEVEIEAVPSDGFIFEMWEGDFEGEDNPASLVMNEDKAITANFREIGSLINIETSGEGTVLTAFDDQTVSLSAAPSEGWIFTRWEGDLSGSENPDTLVPDEEKFVTAVFDPQLTLTVDVEGGGSVETDPDQVYYDAETTVTLTATAESGWRFSEWKGDLSGSENSETLILDEEKFVTAVFNQQFNLTIDVDGGGSVEADPDQEFYDAETTVTLTATAESGWQFSEWKGDISGTDNRVNVTMDGDKSATAVFEQCILCYGR